ncbi:MAG: hypothetical protein Q8Q85_10400, partial [Gemmatimonadales bacterium]|nr:hypothetical protein [Gemmatimonadales bacterium]
PMTPPRTRVPSIATRTAGASSERLLGALSVADSSRPAAEKLIRRELGLLFRYWTTREIWQALDADEAGAKAMNLALLRLFTDGFKLPRDGTGLRYAELSSAADEVKELAQRLSAALGPLPEAFTSELQSGILPWRDAVLQHTREALDLPLPRIQETVRAWTALP